MDLTTGWDIWKDIAITPYTLNVNGLTNLSEQELLGPPGTFPPPYYDTHYMQFKVIWKGLSYLRLCVDYLETYDQKGEDLIKNHNKDGIILSLVGDYNDPSHVLGFFGLNEPSSIDNYEPFKYIENLIKGVTSNNLHLFTTFTTGWNGTIGGQWGGQMNFDVYQGSEFIKRTKLPYISLNTYIYNYPYNLAKNGQSYYLDNITEVINNNLAKLNAESILFSYSTQSGRFYDYDDNLNNEYYINPSSEQMMYHINLGMLYGAKELTCDPLFTLSETVNNIVKPYRDGLAVVNENGYTLSTLGETWKNYIKPRMAGFFGKTLKNIIQSNQYPDINSSTPYNFITSIDSDIPGYDLGFFTGQPDIKYFMLLRRWYQTYFSPVIISYDLNNTGYKNYKLCDYIDSTYSYKNSIDTIHFTANPGDGRLFSLAPVVLYGGNILYNETVSGTKTLTSSMTIKSGATLTISGTYNIQADVTVESGGSLVAQAGSIINLQNGSRILVTGGQFVASSLTTPITINCSTTINGYASISITGSGSQLKNVTINNGNGIECLLGANITIMNCTLNNCNNGIYIFNSQPQIIGNIIYNPQQNGIYGEASGLSPLIQANTITRTTNLFNFQGIYLGNSTHPTIINNTISGFSYGSYLGGGCVTQMGGIYYQCNNTFTGNVEGLTTAWGSTTVAGRSNHTGNSNAVYGNNLYDAHSYQYGNLSSYYDYWGGKFLADGTSSNNIQWRLTTNPCNIANQSTSNNDLTSNSMNKSTADDVLVGLDLENEGKIDDAIDFYKNLINNDNYVYFALTNLVAIKNKYSRPEINDYFVNILNSHNKHYGKVKKLMGDICLQNNQFDDAVKAYTEVITNSSTDYDAINARFELLFGYLHIKNNTTLASKLLSELKGMNLTDAEHLIRLQIAYNFINGKGTGMKKNVIPQNNIMPTTYLLYQNYPNPFNPTTTIKYQIPKPGMVSLKVYDILGREMATLVNGNKVEGTYDISFDASRLTNGIYIYQLKVNDYVSNKKMILLK